MSQRARKSAHTFETRYPDCSPLLPGIDIRTTNHVFAVTPTTSLHCTYKLSYGHFESWGQISQVYNAILGRPFWSSMSTLNRGLGHPLPSISVSLSRSRRLPIEKERKVSRPGSLSRTGNRRKCQIIRKLCKFYLPKLNIPAFVKQQAQFQPLNVNHSNHPQCTIHFGIYR